MYFDIKKKKTKFINTKFYKLIEKINKKKKTFHRYIYDETQIKIIYLKKNHLNLSIKRY